MKLKRFACVLMSLTIALGGLLMTGCNPGDKEGNTSSSITIGIPQDLDGLDPHKVTAAGTREILFNVFEGLVKVDSDGNLVPAVASEVKPGEDGSSYTFTLRDGVKFHDGSVVTAEDVKYSLDRCADATGGAPLVSAFSNVKSVEIKDSKTVTVNLETPDTEFLANLTIAIIPASNKDPEKNVIGTGPYKYVSWTPQEEVVLTRNDDYWGDKAYIKDVKIKIISDGDSIVTSLNGGSIDFFARLSSDQVSQLSSDFQVYEGTMNLVQALYLNNAEKPFDDVRVRQALCYATDVQEILDMTSDGKGTPVGSSMFPAFGKYYMEELNNTYTKDLDKAKALLKEAGYENGFTFKITVPSNYQPHIDTAQVLKEQFKEIGVTAEIEKVEWATWLSDVYSGRKFTSTVIGVDASTLTAPAMLSRFVSDAGNNFINYNNKDYDAAYAKAIGTTNDAEKTAAYKECEKILSETAANVYIQDMAEFVALNKKYTGYTFYPMYIQDLAKIKPVDAK